MNPSNPYFIAARSSLKLIDELLADLKKRRKKITDWLESNGQTSIEVVVRPCQMYSLDFEIIWALYPARNGMKREKNASWKKFKKNFTKAEDIAELKKAIVNYSKSQEVKDGFARDMVRFLKPDFWMEWAHPTEAMMHGSQPVEHKDKTIDRGVEEAINAATGRKKT